VTEEKQAFQEQYQDRLSGNELAWEGPTDHYGQDRILSSSSSSDEIHLFHRDKHHTDFTYMGRLKLIDYKLHCDKPSTFKFQVV